MNSFEYETELRKIEKEKKKSKMLIKSKCPDCGRKMIIAVKDKVAQTCGTCKAIGVKASKEELLMLNRNSYNSKFEVPNV